MQIDPERLKTITEVVGGWVTIAAVLVGGWWSYRAFFRKRESYPQATLSHSLTHRALPGGSIWLRVSLVVQNHGEVLLTLASTSTRVQQIIPVPVDLVASLARGEDPPTVGHEYDWPLLAERSSEGASAAIQVEPGEQERYEIDFFLDGEPETVQVYSYVKNIKRRDREMGWGLTTIYEVTASSREEAC